MTLRTGLFGGTFDPVHFGHLMAAEAAREAADLAEVWFVPVHVPPHKPPPEATVRQRLDMLELAIRGVPHFRVEPIELDRPGPSYTIDTIEALGRRFPDRSFYLIVGSDMANDLPNWHRAEELARRVRFIALERPGEPVREEALPEPFRERLMRAPMPPVGIASAEIRRRVREGRSIRFYVPEPVREYIAGNGLYAKN
ncbi:MAG TPA: nicotinate (nicotinamide) nucleotide adenylyltransferase [Paenibacillaceae bacterium]